MQILIKSLCTLSVVAAFALQMPIVAFAQDSSNRMWLLWENQSVNPRLCEEKGLCDPISTYISRLINEPSANEARTLIGSMDQLARSRGELVDHPEAPSLCLHTNEADILGFDAESWPISEKLAALKDLEGVYINVISLKGPSDYEGRFGVDVQNAIDEKFAQAGIPLLSEIELETTPGRPHLNIYFSNTNADTGCWFSIFASLTQTMLLTRNHTIKVKAGSWGFSGGYSADQPDRSEFDAILLVVDRFVEDFKKANPNGVKSKF